VDCDLSWLTGRALVAAESLGRGTWRFAFGDGTEVRAECPWRVVQGGGIVLSSEDHGLRYGLPQPIDAAAECGALLGGAIVRSAEARDETRDIIIAFASGTRLEVVPLSSGYEGWQVVGPDGSLTVAQGGGNLSVWGAHAEPGAAADGGGM
jgi:hypothetical protein